jgi:AcrR family transcriptional regulator
LAYRQTERVRARLQATRKKLLKAALALVAEEGFAGLQVARVAENAGVATGTLYRHFPNKTALCVEVYSRASDHEMRVLQENLRPEVAGCEGVADRIEFAVTTWVQRAHEAVTMARALLHEPVDAEVEAVRIRYRGEYARIFAATLSEGIASGELPDQDVEVVSSCLVGALSESVLGPSGPRMLPAIVRFCMAAIRPVARS